MIYTLEHLDIEINHLCNLACRHCSASAMRSASDFALASDEICGIIQAAKAIGLKKVGLTGGEPLIEPAKTEEIAGFCVKELGLSIHIHTNGTSVTKEMCRPGGILSLFESVSVSFLGASPATHDTMTGLEGSFQRAYCGAQLIAGAGLPLTCYFIPTHGTCNGFEGLAERLRGIGVSRIRAMALAPSGRARATYDKTAPVDQEWREFEKSLLEVSRRLGLTVEAGNCTRLSMPGLSVLPGHDECMSGINRVHINWQGDVFPCTAASGVKELFLGNVRASSVSLEDIWFESKLISQIRLVREGRMAACANCPKSPKCRDSCIVKVFGTMTDADSEFCPLIKDAADRQLVQA